MPRCAKSSFDLPLFSAATRPRGAWPPSPASACRGTALAASATDPSQFRSGRQFAARLGLTPRQASSGGKERLGRINKMGDKYLRQLLVIGATALVRGEKEKPKTADPRFVALLARKSVRIATFAMADKMARIAWAIMTRGETYRAHHVPAQGA